MICKNIKKTVTHKKNEKKLGNKATRIAPLFSSEF